MNKTNFISVIVAVSVSLVSSVTSAQVARQPQEENDSLFLSIETCREMAKNGNATIKNAYLDIEAARHQKMEAFAEYFPNVSINSMGFYSINPLLEITMHDVLGYSDLANNIINQVNQMTLPHGFTPGYKSLDYGFVAMASVIQPVFAGGRIVNGNRLARLGIDAARLKTHMTEVEQQEEIDKKYWQIISLEEKGKSLSSGEELASNIYKTVSSAKNAGIALDTDLLMVQKEQNNLKSKRKRLESGMRLAKMDLLNSIGQPFSVLESNACPEAPFIDRIGFEAGLDSLKEPDSYYVDEFEAAANSTESQLLELSVRAAELQKKMEVGATLPEIGIGFAGGYGKLLGPDPAWNGIALAKISIPITDWWKTSHKAHRLEIKVQQAENQKKYLQSQLTLKAQMLWQEVLCTWEEFQIAEDNVKLSRISYSRAEMQFTSGQATISDYLKAGSDLQLSLDALTDSKIAYQTALAKYLNMTGGTNQEVSR